MERVHCVSNNMPMPHSLSGLLETTQSKDYPVGLELIEGATFIVDGKGRNQHEAER
jgi:hypothetical protein